jgi:type IV pilus assembly protein PilC
VKRGSKISQVLERYPEEIPPLFVKMVLVGEKTGRLDRSLSNLVSFYQREMDWALEGLVRMLEPAIIVVLGVMVGGLIISILLPLYRVGVF